jgi:hypothetical protein
MPPDEPNDEERLEELPEDNGETPFRPAAPARDDDLPADDTGQTDDSQLDDTHPVTDTNIQPEELYDEGVSGAAEAGEPNAGDAVVDYTPPDKADSPG